MGPIGNRVAGDQQSGGVLSSGAMNQTAGLRNLSGAADTVPVVRKGFFARTARRYRWFHPRAMVPTTMTMVYNPHLPADTGRRGPPACRFQSTVFTSTGLSWAVRHLLAGFCGLMWVMPFPSLARKVAATLYVRHIPPPSYPAASTTAGFPF